MKADAVPLLDIFEKKMRLEVPLFQRQYVWSSERHWEPLWEDIARKFAEFLDGRKDAPVHFLGAMVLDQKQTPTTHVEKRQVIDGQQRLTTFQIFLAAFADFCDAHGSADLSKEAKGFTLNRGMMASPDVDRFKVWPTLRDQPQFVDVMTAGSRAILESLHPLIKVKYTKRFRPRPRMVEAYFFFYEQLADFFVGSETEPPIGAQEEIGARLDECFQALKNALQVVVIDLDHDDDAQVIFETLNSRGEPLLPADLLRNYIFLRAARKGEPQESLYNEYWRRFDDPFWRVESKQGRLLRPRSDLFMQHFLASRLAADIPVKHLFVEYKYWIERDQPFNTVREELAALSRQGEDFRRLIDPKKDDVLFPLVAFLDSFDIRTVYPLLLTLLDVRLSDLELAAAGTTLESYLLRRAVCGLTTKNYNRVFLGLTRGIRKGSVDPARLHEALLNQSGESVEWPSDSAFREAILTRHTYLTLNNPKIVHLLRRLGDTFLTSRMEPLNIAGPLTVEHLMPRNWLEHWPLTSGQRGMDATALFSAEVDSPLAIETRRRNAALQTIGNLTILTQPLNSTVSNRSWDDKKPELLRNSLLPINQHLANVDIWDETSIHARGEDLFVRAREVWSRGEHAGAS